MDLRQLHALVAVADHGTFSAAADALTTVQSNVSTHIRRLERELGATLVDRQAGRLTQEGEAVVERARRVQAELDALVADVAALKHDVTGRVRAGIIGTTARWLVPLLLDEMASRHPHVDMEIVDATSTSLEPQLVTGRLDLAVVNLPLPSPDVVTEPLFDEDLLLFVPADHPLARTRNVGLSQLADIPLFLPPRGTAFRQLIDRAALGAGVALRSRAELDGIRLIASLAIAGQGAAIVPATAIPTDLQGSTRPVAVRGLPRREVGVALRRRALPGAPARAFLGALRDIVGDASLRPAHVHPQSPPAA
ncbi:MAG TPA: LysR family transcriptional regulator [Acidimicrobiales bacterium]